MTIPEALHGLVLVSLLREIDHRLLTLLEALAEVLQVQRSLSNSPYKSNTGHCAESVPGGLHPAELWSHAWRAGRCRPASPTTDCYPKTMVQSQKQIRLSIEV